MPRSASRVTWQIVKEFSPEKPSWWDSKMNTGNSIGWSRPHEVMSYPIRSHSHVSSIDPVIYTYRNPIESYMSLKSRLEDTDRKNNAAYEILAQTKVMSALRRDEMKGRQVLWVKYEEFTDLSDRIKAIGVFMNVRVSSSQVSAIAEKLNIKANLEKSQRHSGEKNAFLTWEDKSSGMQGNHINDQTLGEPGAYIKLYPKEYDEILNACSRSELGQLRSFAAELGY